MSTLKRILLFSLANLAVIVLLGVVLRLVGVDHMLAAQGVDIGIPSLLVFASVLGFGGSFVSLALSKTIAKWSTGARVITSPRSQEEAWLLETVRAHATRAGIGMPEVAIYDSPDMNAFATGMRRDKALVAVSTGLLVHMSRDEAAAVLAHEVSHVANGDMVTLALLQGVLNTFVIFISRVVGWVVDRMILQNERGLGPGYWLTVLATEITLGLGATMLVMWFSRYRELRADRGGAALAGRSQMIRALERLRAMRAPGMLPQSMSAFGIRGGGSVLMRLFRSHPPLEERIAALRATAATAA